MPQEAAAELARRHLIDFAILTKSDYQVNWHHEVIADYLEAIERGDIDRLLITAPPRHGKSELASIRFPVWFLGRNPTKSVMLTAYNQDLANDFGAKGRDVAMNIEKWLFHDFEVSQSSHSSQRWNTTNDGRFVATGIGGSITGRGAHVLIIEDPIKNKEEADSKAFRDKQWEWYKTTARTRLEKGGAIIIIMTRWHEADLAGRALKAGNGEWTIVNLTAIAEKKEQYRDEGNALWPWKYPIDVLERTRRDIGVKAWGSLFQGRPVIDSGGIFKLDYWKYYKELPKPKRVIQSWDTAFKTKESNDYSVCETWYEVDNGYYLKNVYRERVEFPQLLVAAKALYHKENPNIVLVEDKASGQSLIQTLRQETPIPIKAITVDKDKVARANAITPLIESGCVFLPEEADWLADFLDEHVAFPNSEHDDQVDTTTQALGYMKKKPFIFWLPGDDDVLN